MIFSIYSTIKYKNVFNKFYLFFKKYIDKSIDDEILEDAPEEELAENSDWSFEESVISENGFITARAYVKFPFAPGEKCNTGIVAHQSDDTFIIFDSQKTDISPIIENDDIKNVFPAYFAQTENIFKTYYDERYFDFCFEIKDGNIVTINDHDMYRCTGIHSHRFNGELIEMYFVAYATKQEVNDAWVYWVVLGNIKDEKISEVVNGHADKMAETFRG